MKKALGIALILFLMLHNTFLFWLVVLGVGGFVGYHIYQGSKAKPKKAEAEAEAPLVTE